MNELYGQATSLNALLDHRDGSAGAVIETSSCVIVKGRACLPGTSPHRHGGGNGL